jgi:hypothetical protein
MATTALSSECPKPKNPSNPMVNLLFVILDQV